MADENTTLPVQSPEKTLMEQVVSGVASPSALLTPQEAQKAKPEASENKEKAPESTQPPAKPEGQAQDEEVEKHLESRLFQSEKPEEKLSRLERDSKASQKEALRLRNYVEKLKELHDSQSLEIAEENGLPIGLLPGKGYSKEAKALNLKFSELTEDQQALFDDPQKAIDFVLKEAKKAFVRASPSMEPSQRPLSNERKDEAFSYVKSLKSDDNETALYPNLDRNRPIMERMLNGPQAIKGLKELMNQNPEFAVQLLDRHIEAVRSVAVQTAKKQLESEKKPLSPPIGPTSGGSADPAGIADYQTRMGKAIASA